MELKNGENSFVLGLDVSTKTIGIALFENEGNSGKLKLLHHVTPQVKPKPKSDMQTLFEKARIFEEEFLICLLYTSPSPRDLSTSRMPSSA